MGLTKLVEKYKLGEYKPTGVDYELYITQEFIKYGYHAYKTKSSGDQGADIVININPHFKIVIQCKYYSSNLNNTPVQEVIGAMKYYNAQMGVVITNKDYTSGARNLAKINNIMLINHFDFGSDIIRIIKLFGFYPKLDSLEEKIDALKLELNSIEAENKELISIVYSLNQK